MLPSDAVAAARQFTPDLVPPVAAEWPGEEKCAGDAWAAVARVAEVAAGVRACHSSRSQISRRGGLPLRQSAAIASS